MASANIEFDFSDFDFTDLELEMLDILEDLEYLDNDSHDSYWNEPMYTCEYPIDFS